MAKTSDVSFVELHIEKIVLGATVLFLLIALWRWVGGTPTRVEVGRQGQEVVPAEVDEKILEQAEMIKARAARATTEEIPQLPDYSKQLQQLRDKPFQETLAVGNLGEPQIAKIDPSKGSNDVDRPTLASLLENIPAPIELKAAGGPELLDRQKEPDVLTAHGELKYPLAKLKRQWNEVLQATTLAPVNPVVLRVEVQRQERLSDGSFGPAKTIVPVRVASDEDGLQKISIPRFTGSNGQEVLDAIADCASPYQQEYILRPAYWYVWAAQARKWTSWKYLVPWGEKNLEALPTKEGAMIPEAPATPERRVPERRRPATRTPRRQPGGAIPGPELMPPGDMPGMPGGPGMPQRTDRTRTRTTPRRTTPRRTTPAPRPPVTPEVAVPGVPGGGPGMPGTAINGTRSDGVVRREGLSAEAFETDSLTIWFHDADVNVQKKYRYRVRVVFVNPLYAHPKDVGKENVRDAYEPEIVTPWSDWSQDVFVPRSTDFFVTAAFSVKKELTCTVFAQAFGQWVEQKFKVSEGKPIGGKVSKSVINPATGEVRTVDVDFSTGAIVVDIDFNRKIVVRGGRKKQTEELLFLDMGQLHSKVGIKDLDREHPRRQKYDELKKSAKSSEDAVKRVTTTTR